MEMGLEGKVAVVGGASKGIGKAIALALAYEGVNLAICSRTQKDLDKVAQEIKLATSVEVLTITGDLSYYQTIKDLIHVTSDWYGRLDIVISNSGGPPPGLAEIVSEEEWIIAIQRCLMFCIRMAREAIPHMRENHWGRIINILSVTTKQPLPYSVLSTATRMGVVGYTKTLADEVGKDNILINNVCPGHIFTERHIAMLNVWAKNKGVTVDQMIAEEAETIPVRRAGKPNEVAALVLFLASNKANYITGTTIEVDGGLGRAMF